MNWFPHFKRRAVRLGPPLEESSESMDAFEKEIHALLHNQAAVLFPPQAAPGRLHIAMHTANAAGAGNTAKTYPSSHRRKLAKKALCELIRVQDSIISDPKDLAKRAWEIADAMNAEYEARDK